MTQLHWRKLLVLVGLLTGLSALGAFGQADNDAPKVRAELLAGRTLVAPGEQVILGLRLHMQPHWHTYWLNPGDSGLPTTVHWQDLPKGVTIDTIQWPTPGVFVLDEQVNYGYEHQATLLLPLSIADDFTGDSIRLTAEARWLACREACIRESQMVSLTLEVGEGGESRSPIITKALQQLPQPLAEQPTIQYSESNGFNFRFIVPPVQQQQSNVLVLSRYESILQAITPEPVDAVNHAFTLELAASPYLSAVPAHLSGLVIFNADSPTPIGYQFTHVPVETVTP